MTEGPFKRISRLLVALPSSDLKYGKNYLDKKDYESLQLLINSALYNIEKAWAAVTPSKKQKILREEFPMEGNKIAQLETLKGEVDEYYEFLRIVLGDSYEDAYGDDQDEDY